MKLNAPRGSATRIEFDFQPSMQFLKAVKLRVRSDYLAGTRNKYTLWYFDPDTKAWVMQAEQTIDPDPTIPVTFNVNHFSGYALSR